MFSNGDVAQDVGVIPNKDAVAQRGMPLADVLARAAQGHALVHGHVVAHDGGLANHHAHPVIDKQPPPNARAGMNLNAGMETSDLRHRPRQKSQALAPEPVMHPMRPHRVQARIAEQHHRPRSGRGVALDHAADIFPNRIKQVHSATLEVGVLNACWRNSSNSSVERYRSPKSGSTTTINLPACLGSRATFTAACTAAPEEMPTSRPSSLSSRRAMAKASSLVTWTTSSISSVFSTPGTNPAPIPWILCAPAAPPESTGLSVGSTATVQNPGLRGLGYSSPPRRRENKARQAGVCG